MPTKQNKEISFEGVRDITIKLTPVSGGITLMYAFINGVAVIRAEGAEDSWTGKIPEMQVTLKIRVLGIGEASFKLGIDLPGTINDQSITYNLEGGYYETEITI